MITPYSNIISVQTSCFDPDAQAFITAAAITDATQQQAINTLVIGLKAQSLWTKMKAVYPFVGGTASQHKFNLKDPRDLDAAFRLVFSGSWTHSANGALSGANGYANTYFIPSTNGLTYINNHISYYSRTQAAGSDSLNNYYDMGAGNGSAADNLTLFVRRQNDTSGYDCSSFTNRITFSNTDGRGFYNGTASSTTGKFFKNGVSQATKSLSNIGITSRAIFIGASNEGGSPLYYTPRQCAFASLGDGLSDTDASNLYTLVQAFQTTLSRNV